MFPVVVLVTVPGALALVRRGVFMSLTVAMLATVMGVFKADADAATDVAVVEGVSGGGG